MFKEEDVRLCQEVWQGRFPLQAAQEVQAPQEDTKEGEASPVGQSRQEQV